MKCRLHFSIAYFKPYSKKIDSLKAHNGRYVLSLSVFYFLLALIGFAEFQKFVVSAFFIQHTCITNFNHSCRNCLYKFMVM